MGARARRASAGDVERDVELDVDVLTNRALDAFDGSEARLTCVFGGCPVVRAAQSLVLVTARLMTA